MTDEETDLSTTPHRLGGADAEALGADMEPSLMDQALLTDPVEQGIVYLRGTVAGRVEGVREVMEELEVTAL